MNNKIDTEALDTIDLYVASLERSKQRSIDAQEYERAAVARDDAQALRRVRDYTVSLRAELASLRALLAECRDDVADARDARLHELRGRQRYDEVGAIYDGRLAAIDKAIGATDES